MVACKMKYMLKKAHMHSLHLLKNSRHEHALSQHANCCTQKEENKKIWPLLTPRHASLTAPRCQLRQVCDDYQQL